MMMMLMMMMMMMMEIMVNGHDDDDDGDAMMIMMMNDDDDADDGDDGDTDEWWGEGDGDDGVDDGDGDACTAAFSKRFSAAMRSSSNCSMHMASKFGTTTGLGALKGTAVLTVFAALKGIGVLPDCCFFAVAFVFCFGFGPKDNGSVLTSGNMPCVSMLSINSPISAAVI